MTKQDIIERRNAITRANGVIRKNNADLRESNKTLQQAIDNQNRQMVMNAEMLRDNQEQFEAAGRELKKLT